MVESSPTPPSSARTRKEERIYHRGSGGVRVGRTHTWSTETTCACSPSPANARLGYRGSRHALIPVGDDAASSSFRQSTPSRTSFTNRRDPVSP